MQAVFLEIINKHLVLQFIVFYIIYGMAVIVFLRLGLQFYGINVKIVKLMPYSLVIPLYNIFGQAFIQRPVYSLIFLAGYVLILKFIGKTSIIKNFIAMMFILFLSSIGIIIVVLVSSSNHNPNFVYTQSGGIIGCISEVLFPFFTLVIFSSFNISLSAYKNKLSKLDKLSMVFFTMLFFAIYFLLISFIVIYSNLRNSIFIIFLVSELILVIGAVILFFIINYISKVEHRKQLENQQIKLELEQSDRLLETFSSEQREYRNQLQVMKMLSQMGKNEELGRYIEQVATGISIGFTFNIENPIISSLLMSEIILAREKGVNVKVQCNTSLKDINPVKIGKILKLSLEIFIERELATRNDQNNIFLDITENDKEYLFKFENSEASLHKILTKSIISKPIIDFTNFALIKSLLNDLNGSYQLLDNGYILSFRFNTFQNKTG